MIPADPTLATIVSEQTSPNLPLGIIIMHGMVAVFGAITHAIRAHRAGKSKGPVDFLLLTVMSSFSGMLFAFAAFQVADNAYFTLAAAGAGGFLGVEGLAFMSDLIKNALAESIKKK